MSNRVFALRALMNAAGSGNTQNTSAGYGNFAASSVKFNYNGEILPMLPPEDVKKYTYIVVGRFNGSFAVVYSSSQWYRYASALESGETEYRFATSGKEAYRTYNSKKDEWGNISEGDWYFALTEVFWSNADIRDGSSSSAEIYRRKDGAPIPKPVQGGGGTFVQNYYSCVFTEGLEDLAEGEYFPVQNTFLKATGGGKFRKNTSETVDFLGQFTASNRAEMIRQCIQTGSDHCGGVVVGTGTAKPTLEDYKMSAIIPTEDVTITPEMVFPFIDAHKTGIMGVYTLQNNTDAEIAVSEVGLYAHPGGYRVDDWASETLYWYSSLFERTLLNEPITLPAGASAQLVYVVYP